jgi:hypothetical protein
VISTALAHAALKAKVGGIAFVAAVVGGTAAVAVTGPASFTPVSDDQAISASASPEATTSAEATQTPEPTESPAAAQIPGSTESPEPTESPEAAESPDPTESPAAVVTPDAPAVTPTATCPAGLTNHGQYVSSVARDHSKTGAEHGRAVSEAAHSDCGKTPAEVATSEPTETPDADSQDVGGDDPSTTSPKPKQHKADKGHRASHGR